MAASYPTAAKSFSTKTNGSQIAASHVNDLQDEVVAIETDLLAGVRKVNYTWPSADGSSGQVLQTNGSKVLSWATPVAILQDFRLSLTSGTSVTTSDVTAATTLYFTPHVGRRCTIFDASGNATVLTSAEISIAVPASTSQMYDVFVYSNSGTLALELLAWTNDTTRATAIVKNGALDAAGVYCKSGDLTRRYVGSFRTTTVSGQTEDSLAKRYVWNYFNRVDRALFKQDSTASWTYTTATIRQANGATTNQCEIVVGVAEVALSACYSIVVNDSAAGLVAGKLGIGIDSTTAFAGSQNGNAFTVGAQSVGATPLQIHVAARMEGYYPAVGRHTVTMLEAGTGGGATTTWYGAGTYNGAATLIGRIAG